MGRGGLFRFEQERPQPADSSHIRFDLLNGWRSAGAGADIRPPFAALGDDTLILSTDFTLNTKNTAGFTFYCQGFPGSAAIYLNNRLLLHTRVPWAPREHNVDAEMLRSGTNKLRLVLSAYSSVFPVFSHVYSAPPFLAVSRPFGLRRAQRTLIENFSYDVPGIREKAEIAFSYTINNTLQKKQGYVVEETVRDASGRILFKRRKNLRPESAGYGNRFNLSPARMWTPETPRFVTLTITVKHYQQLIEEKSFTLGIRRAQFSNNRFLLNGRPLRVKGLNFYFNPREISGQRPSDYYLAQLRIIKKAGFNAVRFPGMIPPRSVFSIADTLGLMIFAELPIRRYPADIIQNELLLNTTRSAIQTLFKRYGPHASFIALGLGSEIRTTDPAIQRFFIISSEAGRRPAPLLSYLAPGGNGTFSGLPVDFYLFLKYGPADTLPRFSAHIGFLPGNTGQTIIRRGDEIMDDFIMRKSGLLKSWFTEHKNVFAPGYFIDAYNDQPVDFALSAPAPGQPFALNPAGLFRGGAPNAIRAFQDFHNDSTTALSTPVAQKPDNFFAVVLFFWTIIFLFFYRRYPNFRDNFKRAMRHTYGFFVDMRERRIIPVFNTLMVGFNSVMVLSVLVASTIFYYSGSPFFREMTAILFPDKELYYLILEYASHPWYLLAAIIPLIFIHPLIVGIFIKSYALMRGRYVRFRQTIAIGMWAGAPFAFMMPFSLVAYHAHYYGSYTEILWLVVLLFILWAHYRLINGIRVLMVVPFGYVFLILFLSYIIPLVIFFAFFNPQPLWFEQLLSLINSRMLF